MSDWTHRNILALNEAQQAERARLDAALARMQHLEAQHQMMVAELTSLRQMVAQLLVTRGHGATAGVRNDFS
jgi:division protein CdvB (Snf7/Vps24/ESCRT-III family)